MTSTFRIITESHAPRRVLFDQSLSIDAHLSSMHASRETAISGVTSGRIRLGESVTWRARHFGIWWTMTSTVTALDAPASFVDEQVRGPFRIFRHEHRFEDRGKGTRMTDVITVASPIFGRLAERLILIPYLRRLITNRNSFLLAATATGTERP